MIGRNASHIVRIVVHYKLFNCNYRQMMSLAGLDAHQSTMQKRLLNAFQVLEENRAILYGDDTFLSEGKWSFNNRIGTKQTAVPDPMADIIELMI
ncbi:hypothetical protein MKX08_008002 [Trichoderma sp. CBMAI-0020]|nr:hypothetical protein MKX08_008002 [Trichoderma sp. CBMAI-0020]